MHCLAALTPGRFLVFLSVTDWVGYNSFHVYFCVGSTTLNKLIKFSLNFT
jgi:hypothetical protein